MFSQLNNLVINIRTCLTMFNPTILSIGSVRNRKSQKIPLGPYYRLV
ncbi:hypothetical protein HanRHA438_Chr11g0513951 [Helianthus annuus]|nr:hypothetical protein HanIR_Chr11g0539721 [Helianthus annuus]KAJ0871565.1 hypothetical protein HanRHA438_Chr11g0513951 [Helianthus annuus]